MGSVPSITIIGSGLAGYTLVREIRRLDKDFPITVITEDSGDYYSKPQLSTAFTNHKSADQLILIPREKFAAQFNINIMTDKTVDSLTDISSSSIVFATGAKPKILSFFKKSPPFLKGGLGGISGKIFSVNHLKDYNVFRKAIENHKHITIIGAGLVGCEFANDLINGGYKVTIIAPEEYPLARLVPREIGMALKEAFIAKGIKWQLGENYNISSLFSEDEIILSAIGLKPETTLAQAAGIAVNQGILVNSYLQTSQPHIYALGDCMEYEEQLMPYIAPIAVGARALAKTLLGEPTAVIYPLMPIYIKTPAYPIVVLHPKNPEGEWQIERDNNSIRALFYQHNKLKGFALGGSFVAEAVDWLKKI